MYTRKERMKAIKLYLKYDKSKSLVIRKLGYPNPKKLAIWYREYTEEQVSGIPHDLHTKMKKYSQAEKKIVIEHFYEYGCNISRSVRMLGYPSRPTLRNWLEELSSWSREKYTAGIQYTHDKKKEAVLDLCTRNTSARNIAKKHGVRREILYRWKDSILGKEFKTNLMKNNSKPINDKVENLKKEAISLEQQIERLKLEKAILEGATELIKKDQGIDIKILTNKERTKLVDALRDEFPLGKLIESLCIAKSSYFYHHNMLKHPDKYDSLRSHIIELFVGNNHRYGYRRIHALLKKSGICVSEKVVRRLMAEQNLIVKGKRKRKFSSYMGENDPAADNLLERDFSAESPNKKWLTDITEFRIPAGKVYLSPIVDCFDGLLPAWTIGTVPNADLVNNMLDYAVNTLGPGEYPIIHSDQGAHYRWKSWISRIEDSGLQRSMSAKACPQDNAACEGFFGRLKNEMFYYRDWKNVSVDEFINTLNEYLNWYNEKRIKISLGAMSPLEYRRSLGMAI